MHEFSTIYNELPLIHFVPKGHEIYAFGRQCGLSVTVKKRELYYIILYYIILYYIILYYIILYYIILYYKEQKKTS